MYGASHTRAFTDATITWFNKIVPDRLDSVTVKQMKKFFRTCRDYDQAYREGASGSVVEKCVKVYSASRHM